VPVQGCTLPLPYSRFTGTYVYSEELLQMNCLSFSSTSLKITQMNNVTQDSHNLANNTWGGVGAKLTVDIGYLDTSVLHPVKCSCFILFSVFKLPKIIILKIFLFL